MSNSIHAKSEVLSKNGGLHEVPPFLLIFLTATCLFWACFSWITNHTFDSAIDMLENYVWGIRWQWGNSKHPPLFGWTVALWFEIFPKTKFSYWMLTSVNLTASLAIMILIARRFLNKDQQWVVLLVAFVSPLLTTQAMRYNANAAMLPYWAGVVLFYIRLYEKPKLVDAGLLGLLGALAMMSKYFSLTLLIALFTHAMITPKMRKIVFSTYGVLATGVFFTVLTPHIIWLFENDFSPMTFASSGQGDGNVLYSQLKFIIAQLVYLLPGYLTLGLYRSPHEGLQVFNHKNEIALFKSPIAIILLYSFLGSIVTAMILSLLFWSPLTSNWTVPTHIVAPILLVLILPRQKITERPNLAWKAVALACIGLIALSPVIYRQTLKIGSGTVEIPFEQIASQAQKNWSDQMDLPIVALGGTPFATYSSSFFMQGKAQVLINGNLTLSPWVSEEQFSQNALLLICAEKHACSQSWRNAGWQLTPLQPISVAALEGAAGPSIYHYNLWAGRR